MSYSLKKINIKTFKIEENKTFLRLSKVYLEEITNKENISKITTKDNYTKIINNRGKIFWVKSFNRIVGFFVIYLNYEKKKYCYIRDIFILKKFRLQKIGTKSFEKIIKFCKQKKFKLIKINILSTNSKVINFWKRLNFKKRGSSYFLRIK